LLFGTVFVDGVHHQGALDRGRGTDAGIAALQLLHDDPVRDLIHATAAVFGGERRPKGADSTQLGDDMFGEFGPLGVVLDDGAQFLFDVLPNTVPNETMFIG